MYSTRESTMRLTRSCEIVEKLENSIRARSFSNSLVRASNKVRNTFPWRISYFIYAYIYMLINFPCEFPHCFQVNRLAFFGFLHLKIGISLLHGIFAPYLGQICKDANGTVNLQRCKRNSEFPVASLGELVREIKYFYYAMPCSRIQNHSL